MVKKREYNKSPGRKKEDWDHCTRDFCFPLQIPVFLTSFVFNVHFVFVHKNYGKILQNEGFMHSILALFHTYVSYSEKYQLWLASPLIHGRPKQSNSLDENKNSGTNKMKERKKESHTTRTIGIVAPTTKNLLRSGYSQKYRTIVLQTCLFSSVLVF